MGVILELPTSNTHSS